MRSKIVTADEAIALIRDGDTVASTGFVQTGFAEELEAVKALVVQPAQPAV